MSEGNERVKMIRYCIYGMGSSRLRCPNEATAVHNEVPGLASGMRT